MRNNISYFLEMMLLIPALPILYYKGKKLQRNLIKLIPQSDFLKINGNIQEPTFLIIGESTAAGVGASSLEGTFASQIFRLTGKKFNIINIGKNGLRAENLTELLESSEKMHANISTAIILIGANDCFKFTPPRKFRNELKSFIEFLLRNVGVKNVIIPMIPPVEYFPSISGLMGVYLGWHRKLLTYEIKSLQKTIPELSYENIESNFDPSFFAEDGIHPSDKGYRLIASEIAEKIE